jgi:hypothetical protein
VFSEAICAAQILVSIRKPKIIRHLCICQATGSSQSGCTCVFGVFYERRPTDGSPTIMCHCRCDSQRTRGCPGAGLRKRPTKRSRHEIYANESEQWPAESPKGPKRRRSSATPAQAKETTAQPTNIHTQVSPTTHQSLDTNTPTLNHPEHVDLSKREPGTEETRTDSDATVDDE